MFIYYSIMKCVLLFTIMVILFSYLLSTNSPYLSLPAPRRCYPPRIPMSCRYELLYHLPCTDSCCLAVPIPESRSHSTEKVDYCNGSPYGQMSRINFASAAPYFLEPPAFKCVPSLKSLVETYFLISS